MRASPPDRANANTRDAWLVEGDAIALCERGNAAAGWVESDCYVELADAQ